MRTITVDNIKYEIVEEVPNGYGVWNIGGLGKYLPLYDMNDNEDFKVNTSTLKAIKCHKGTVFINHAASYGIRNTTEAKRIIERNSSNKQQLEYAKMALPFMEEVKGL